MAAVQNLRRRELKLLTIHENSANILGIKDFKEVMRKIRATLTVFGRN